MFTGKAAVKALLSPAYGSLKNVPKITSEAEAITTLQQTLPFAFYLRVDRQQAQGSSKQLNFSPQQIFAADGQFAWFYEGSQWTTYVGGAAMVAIMLAGVMFPLWPSTLRLGVWYLSILVLALIGVFFGIAIVRLIFYIITVVATPPGIWIFPQLFADVGFVSIVSPIGVNTVIQYGSARSIHSSRYTSGTSPRRREGRRRRLRRRGREKKRRKVQELTNLEAHTSKRSTIQRARDPSAATRLWRTLPTTLHNSLRLAPPCLYTISVVEYKTDKHATWEPGRDRGQRAAYPLNNL
jgi:protein translocation Sec62 family protein